MPQATDSGSSNGLSGVKGWLLFLCITLVFLLPILKAGTTLYAITLSSVLSDGIGYYDDLRLSYQPWPEAAINELATEKEKEAADD